ncbi:MAG: hypothetical protein VKM92_03045 [Cyanobacteriota bacterium]|nr:hypothetical protein [Cyanobacteriota bacterium]
MTQHELSNPTAMAHTLAHHQHVTITSTTRSGVHRLEMGRNCCDDDDEAKIYCMDFTIALKD